LRGEGGGEGSQDEQRTRHKTTFRLNLNFEVPDYGAAPAGLAPPKPEGRRRDIIPAELGRETGIIAIRVPCEWGPAALSISVR